MAMVILTGSSGVGKTTIARAVRRAHPEVLVALEGEMARPEASFLAEWERREGPTEGPGGPVQRGMALRWLPELARQGEGRAVVVEMQCRVAFLEEAVRVCGLRDVEVVLVECGDAVREERLRGRGSPEMVHEEMRNWGRYLRWEAEVSGLRVLDAEEMGVEGCVRWVMERLRELGAGGTGQAVGRSG